MNRILLLLAPALIAGCGADTLSTAATIGAARTEEAKNAKNVRDQVGDRVNASIQNAEQIRRDAEQRANQ